MTGTQRYGRRPLASAPATPSIRASFNFDAARLTNINVYEASEHHRDTGIIDPSTGDMLTVYDGPDPIGFLWDAPRGRADG